MCIRDADRTSRRGRVPERNAQAAAAGARRAPALRYVAIEIARPPRSHAVSESNTQPEAQRSNPVLLASTTSTLEYGWSRPCQKPCKQSENKDSLNGRASSRLKALIGTVLLVGNAEAATQCI